MCVCVCVYMRVMVPGLCSAGGWVLSFAVNKWKGIAVYSPIINGENFAHTYPYTHPPIHPHSHMHTGVGGNLVAVQASRISTSLHQKSSPGKAVTFDLQYKGPCNSFFSKHSGLLSECSCASIICHPMQTLMPKLPGSSLD